MKKTTKQSAVVFLRSDELPKREVFEKALEDLGAQLTWHEEHEIGASYALSLTMNGAVIGLSVVGGPLERDLYAQAVELSGLPDDEKKAIESHGSHARIVFMESVEELVEPVICMTHVYRVAARLCMHDGVAVLAPGSGVLILGLESEHVDRSIEDEIPPLDMWIAVEKLSDDVVKSTGAAIVGIPEVELRGIGILDAETTFSTMMDTLLYLRRIRRELVPGEILHIGRQPWDWMAIKSPEGLLKLKRVDPEESRSLRGSN